jgi:hypothetical protein
VGAKVIGRNECIIEIEMLEKNFGKSKLWKGEEAKKKNLCCPSGS